MHLLEPRAQPSQLMRWTAPLIAIAATLLTGSLLFWALDKSPLTSFEVFFVQPLTSSYGWSELLIKACPLILIAQGLAIGFKARIYNIGAEGQLIVGALFGGGVAIHFNGSTSAWVIPAMVVAGAIGGALWGALPALLKTRFNAEETLTTLMLTYVATFILSYMVNGPWRDPEGMNFPQSIMFDDNALFGILLEGSRVNSSVFITLVAVLAFWLFNARSFLAYQLEVGGQAPAAARYAGFSASQTVWFSLAMSGLTAGLAGVGEVAGPVGQLNLNISPGYGYAAIIVAYLGRLHPLGIVLAGALMALIYLGGEAAQVSLQMPAAITGIFQGMLLFFLLGADAFIDNRLRRPSR
ncbi:MAG TPA: ABC transporter permease [Zoogloea sp.]|uniref:ABC transporter permease n=1 Tax=Zoogloea sp. TaxID=49181 RepID=UPI002BBE15EC|nr:ABC transporter permease [Zoogloea sp.]HMV17621.1 ABC transporter permease [Rhodocyclaceae bacterium]HMV61785.1 ABC transporter permease [Rhodocyclaceae bacterium]HMW51698.1 ABC transporter permease [Rhodocyclaceae bacterium]HMY48408.1 ABC transporter permease [Rhodocyclaceae bacterium]HMZ75595.1 ABC transporter permease [Rhodocyclaceae bacterium]